VFAREAVSTALGTVVACLMYLIFNARRPHLLDDAELFTKNVRSLVQI
jgi:hypothetical protein